MSVQEFVPGTITKKTADNIIPTLQEKIEL